MLLKLSGKTKKGKERIKLFGELWEPAPGCIHNGAEEKVIVSPVNGKVKPGNFLAEGTRWLNLRGDDDFEIEIVDKICLTNAG